MALLSESKQKIGLIHKAYLILLKNRRNYSASTKTKSEVAGGGRKPWKQKGTGQARAGSIRSPLWSGGGVIFGPKPRKIYKKLNKKERKLATKSALHFKKADFSFVDENILDLCTGLIKTKEISNLLKTLNINDCQNILILIPKQNRFFWYAIRNLKNTCLSTVNSLNIEQLLKAQKILLSKSSLELLYAHYGKF